MKGGFRGRGRVAQRFRADVEIIGQLVVHRHVLTEVLNVAFRLKLNDLISFIGKKMCQKCF